VAAVGASTHGKWKHILNLFFIACRGLCHFFLIKSNQKFYLPLGRQGLI
jgi:hypothetical protein